MTYETYEPVAGPAAGAEPGPWRVAIEYSNKGQAKPPTIVQIGSTEFVNHADALATARRTAFEYDPPDPWSPQGRDVFRDGPNGFLVVIQGATATFHMSVRLVEHLGKV
ncbi:MULTISPECIES: hypothetical protein [unclassified Nocardioides]|uniref:hypothetical protein n=1 Tax=unclassified Nocardioides TaxID=2615069 RepID=UPI0006FAAE62|nr:MULTISPECIES: hypothetical protein [unclassified Nocardioides]KRA37349.1 hypothetical protein ASD81_01020 [Nocardioides sp. Root614]KRA91310.1 hypothetical protein ASD84_01285 [Nocardioides sp. Root682]